MCGIGGFVAPHMSPEERFNLARELLVNASVRGTDAAGIAFVDPETKKMVVLKNGVKASDFVQSKEFLALRDRLPSVVIVHARAASRVLGNDASPENNVNNHPFYAEESGLALIHNGLMQDDDEWRDTQGKERGIVNPCVSKTDSEVMLRIIETLHLQNPDEPLVQMISDACFNVAGTYSLAVLSEKAPNTLWLVRHNQDLSICYLTEKDAVVFGSTEQIIQKSIETRQEYLGYFWEMKEPKLVMNTVGLDTVVQIARAKDKWSVRHRRIEAANMDYKYHKAFQAKQEKEGAEQVA